MFCFVSPHPPPHRHALHVGIYPLGLQANINIFSLKLLASMPYFVCLYVYIRWQVCGLLLPQALVKKATSFPKLLPASLGFFTLWKLSLQGPCSPPSANLDGASSQSVWLVMLWEKALALGSSHWSCWLGLSRGKSNPPTQLCK